MTISGISSAVEIDSAAILHALGGADNVLSIEGCIMRLRVVVADANAVNSTALKEAGAITVIAIDEAIQVVVGPQADAIAKEIAALV
ncbi:MAG: glucose PTS transporter subunit EIIB [Actinomycetaceae bacterium]|nr:glucose PTS transporter subunit EIIB [Actinomycetaceae bacterium]